MLSSSIFVFGNFYLAFLVNNSICNIKDTKSKIRVETKGTFRALLVIITVCVRDLVFSILIYEITMYTVNQLYEI